MPAQTPRHATLPAPVLQQPHSPLLAAMVRLTATVLVAAVGVAVLAGTAPARPDGLADRAAVAAIPPVTTAKAVPQLRSRAIEGARAPAVPVATASPRPAKPAVVRRTAVKATTRAVRYVPTGTGMWIYQWDHTGGGDAHRVVAKAVAAGLSTLYLRVGSSHDGFTAQHALPALLAATKGTRLKVVIWDFPTLRHPWHDAHRLAYAAWIGRLGKGPHIAGVAPDIETPAEGTFNAAWRVHAYLTSLRHHLPASVSVLATVPWPSRYRIADYPYSTVAAHSDVIVPMAYWYNNPPALVTWRSVVWLRRFHKPVEPVGQGYDGKLDVPSLPHNNIAKQVPVFLRVAHQLGVRGVSIWAWQNAKPAAWRALAQWRRLFAGRG